MNHNHYQSEQGDGEFHEGEPTLRMDNIMGASSKRQDSDFIGRLIEHTNPHYQQKPPENQHAQVMCGRWLALHRIRRGLDRSMLAEQTRIDPQVILFLESGIADPSLAPAHAWIQLAQMLADAHYTATHIHSIMAIALSADEEVHDAILQQVLSDIRITPAVKPQIDDTHLTNSPSKFTDVSWLMKEDGESRATPFLHADDHVSIRVTPTDKVGDSHHTIAHQTEPVFEQRTSRTVDGFVFRRSLPLFNAKIYALAALSAFFFERLIRTESVWWICPLVAAVACGVLLSASYYAHSVTIYDSFIVIERGFLAKSTVVIPLWQAEFKTTQGFLGQIFDYGTIHQSWSGQDFEITGIAHLQRFRLTVMKRQQMLLSQMMVQPYIVTQQPPCVLAHKRGE
jgi:hypothetical protein